MTPLLTISELAHVLGRSPATIKSDLSRNPAILPPRVQLPGSRQVRWREDDVQQWLAEHVERTGTALRTEAGDE